ncbi:flagellar hook-basal body protein [Aureibacillus halotolerans]|uniref:Flagellar basal-body rod protein FlgG n=1 Tax=Aureibacillus halotolerans TaxID=1508390 RepID=A0A4R6U0G7_9BACI|nr:flagellar hook-basal body protein [Aureibacillus halotolerans]TDQ38702.1 flagellar basal-body rod protein FlgG [Aureibacillus halotolerans]
MNRIANNALVTMQQLQTQLDVISNNMANIDTVGYKSRQARFGELLSQQLDNQPIAAQEQARITPNGIRLGNGAYVNEIVMNAAPGSIKQTNRNLDLALGAENHYFRVEVATEAGLEVQYTRQGNFYTVPSTVAGQLDLVAGDGSRLLDDNGTPISLPSGARDIAIKEDGSLTYTLQSGESETYGTPISVIEVLQPDAMIATNGRLAARGVDEAAVLANVNVNNRRIMAGALEASNVDIAIEMTDMVRAQRAYQLNSRSISIADQMNGLINSMRT